MHNPLFAVKTHAPVAKNQHQVETPAAKATTSQFFEFYQLPAKYKRKVIQNDEIDFINVNLSDSLNLEKF